MPELEATDPDTLTLYQDPFFEEWRWRVQAAGNHETVLASTEGYVHRADAVTNAGRHLFLVATEDPDVYTVRPATQVRALVKDALAGTGQTPITACRALGIPPEPDWTVHDTDRTEET